MSKLIIMKGLPGCGKSTKAQEIFKASGNCVRLNKDLIREMLHFSQPHKPNYVFKGRQEDEVRKAQRELAIYFIKKNKNVIIDDTNLNPKTLNSWVELARQSGISHEVVDMTDVDVITCVMRDKQRMERGERFVGGIVIKNMAIQWGLVSFEPNSVVICDIDGTLADNKHRNHFVANGKKDWHGFFGAMDDDTVRTTVLKDVIDLYNKGKTIILMSGRPETYRERTCAWLEKNYLTFPFTLIMRGSNDSREDSIVKEDLLNTYFPDKQVIHCVYDDRPRVVRMWQRNGLLVHDVGDGIEF